MADFLKRPLVGSLNAVAVKRAADAIHQSGRELPCSIVSIVKSGIVKVKFEVQSDFTLPQIVVPVHMSRYVRLPLQVGDTGVCFAADARLGGITGLGSGVADLSQPANLAALVFCPTGSTAWAVVDLNAVVLTAPNGFVLQDDSEAVSITGTPTDLHLKRGSSEIDLDGTGVKLSGKFGAFGGAPASKPSVTGTLSAVTDTNAKAVLTSIISALVALGLATNGTT